MHIERINVLKQKLQSLESVFKALEVSCWLLCTKQTKFIETEQEKAHFEKAYIY